MRPESTHAPRQRPPDGRLRPGSRTSGTLSKTRAADEAVKLDRVDIGADPVRAHFEGWVYFVWPSRIPACIRVTGPA